MITLLAMIIHAKYNARFEGVFVGTVIIDLVCVAATYHFLMTFWH